MNDPIVVNRLLTFLVTLVFLSLGYLRSRTREFWKRLIPIAAILVVVVAAWAIEPALLAVANLELSFQVSRIGLLTAVAATIVRYISIRRESPPRTLIVAARFMPIAFGTGVAVSAANWIVAISVGVLVLAISLSRVEGFRDGVWRPHPDQSDPE